MSKKNRRDVLSFDATGGKHALLIMILPAWVVSMFDSDPWKIRCDTANVRTGWIRFQHTKLLVVIEESC